MNINTRDLGFVNFNGEEMQWVKFNNVVVYEAWRELIASGVPPITLQKCKGVNLVDYKIYGNSVQESDNLFDKNTMLSGFLPMTGAYPQTNSSYTEATYQIIEMKKGQIFKISYTGDNAVNGRVRYIDNDTNEIVGTISQELNDYYTTTMAQNNGFKDAKITAKKDFKLGFLYLYAKPSNFNLQVISIVPTPEVPIEVKSVGERTSNLFDINSKNYCARTESNLSRIPKVENGIYYSSGKANNFEGAGLYFKINKNTKYMFSCNLDFNEETESNRQILILLFDEINNGVITANQIMYLSRDKGYVYKSFNSGENSYFTLMAYSDNLYGIAFTNIYLGEETSYEPYGYKIPVKVRGKDLFDKTLWEKKITTYGVDIQYLKDEDCFLLNGTATGSTTFAMKYINLPIKKGTYFSLSTKYVSGLLTRPNGTEYAVSYFGKNDEPNKSTNWMSTWLQEYDNKTEKIVCDTDYITAFWFYIQSGVKFDNYKVKIQLEEGNVASEYEPYVEPITTNIYLDEPLRKIGDFADYIDFTNKKVIRKIYNKVCTGTESIGFGARSLAIQGLSPASISGNSTKVVAICNYYETSDWESLWRKGYGTSYTDTQGLAASTTTIRLIDMLNYPNANTDATQTTLFKEWLADSYANSTPMIVDYVLEKSIEETIELPNIPTHKGTTIIEIDTNIIPSNMEVTYKGK